jgi:hypothetical protein
MRIASLRRTGQRQRWIATALAGALALPIGVVALSLNAQAQAADALRCTTAVPIFEVDEVSKADSY